jgi:[ribosomal protein S5]-alanine N-acetyltransferase
VGAVKEPEGLVLETERLWLRRLTPDDLDDLARLYRDPEVRRYFPEGVLTREETKEELEWIIDVYYGRYGYGLWATIEKATGRFIGRCGLLPWKIGSETDGRPSIDFADEFPSEDALVEVEVAYLLDRACWGRGFATEAARAVADYAFDVLHLSRLICLFEPENAASRRVALKIGMGADGEVAMDGELLPLFAMTRHA